MLNTYPVAKPLGFTLIEMMIVITILAISMALGIPSYRTWVQNTQIRNAAESIQNGLQRARTEALVRNTNVAFALIGADSSWQVTQVNPAELIDSRSGAEGSKNVTAAGFDKNLNGAAASTITFSSLATVVVNALVAGVAPPTLRRVELDSTVLSAADSRELWVTIGAGDVGTNVRMCDPEPSLPGTDPRKC